MLVTCTSGCRKIFARILVAEYLEFSVFWGHGFFGLKNYIRISVTCELQRKMSLQDSYNY